MHRSRSVLCGAGAAAAVACLRLPAPAAHGRPAVQLRLRRGQAASVWDAAARCRTPVAAAAPAADSSSASFQRPLSNAERKAKRAEAQRLGRRLCSVNLGQKGLTPAFLEGFRLALAANELVKVGADEFLGSGWQHRSHPWNPGPGTSPPHRLAYPAPQVRVGSCDESRQEVAATLAEQCDCVLVHSIGYTLTFYREAGLPQPTLASRGLAAAGAQEPARGAEEQEGDWEECDPDEVDEEVSPELAAYLLEDEDAFSDSDSDSDGSDGEAGGSGLQAARRGRPPPPPEFTVLS